MPPLITHEGAFTREAIKDIYAADPISGPITILSGTADVIPPNVGGNYIVTTGSADAMTLGAPRVGIDDNVQIAIYSDTLFAHTLTATALLANGTALKTTSTFAAFRGAGILLRAFNGVWQVLATTVAPLT